MIKNLKRWWLFFGVIIIHLQLVAQSDNKLTGLLLDKNTGEPLIGATIISKSNPAKGTITDIDGTFTYQLEDDPETLVFSYIGYKKQQQVVNRTMTNITIELAVDIEALEEIVVIGYGEVKKEDLTGAVVTILPADLNTTAVTNAGQMLQGRVPGLYVSSQNQNPGQSPELILRGRGSLVGDGQPLVVIDGFPMDGTDVLNTVNPNDIAQISILKDASATAIYGSRGANGVIIITTKRAGSSNQGLLVDYGSKFSTLQSARLLDMMNAEEYVRFYLGLANDPNFQLTPAPGFEGSFYPYPVDQINQLPDTDWQSELLNENNFNQEHNLAISGTSGGLQYRLSAGILDNDGFVAPLNYKRYQTLAKLAYEEKKVSINFGVGYTLEKRNNLTNDFLAGVRFAPTVPVRDPSGQLSEHPIEDVQNPFFPEEAMEDFSDVNTTRINTRIAYEVLKGLRLELNGGIQQRISEAFTQQSIPGIFDPDNFNSATLTQTSSQNISGDFLIRYANQWGRHSINGLVGTSYQSFRNRGSNIDASIFPLPDLAYYSIDDGTQSEFASYWNERRIISGLSRLNYDFDKRYFLTLNYRIDGATSFGENNKYGHFPSVAFAWKVDNEGFMKNASLSNLRLKASLGRTGNANLPLARTQPLLEFWPTYIGGQVTRGVKWLGTSTDAVTDNSFQPNPDLKWETSTTLNLSAEVGNEVFYFEANYYRKQTTDAFIDRQVPLETGFSNITLNLGELLNEGVEAKVDFFANFFGGDLQWNPSLWMSYNKNTVVGLAGDSIPDAAIWIGNNFYGRGVVRQEGQPLNAIWGYQFEGIWQENEFDNAALFGAEPGDPRFADLNGDGVITEADQKFIGNADPSYLAGFYNRVTYKRFELSFSIDGVFDKTIINSNRAFLTYPSVGYYRNLSKEVLDRWTPDNTDTEIPSLTKNLPNELVKSTWAIEKTWFVRMRDITITYRLPNENKFFNQFNIYASVSNLFTITPYTGLNPDTWRVDDQWNLQPFMKTYTVGFNLSF
jgi:TonB-linked SusC/RagA family outer membrane protein